MRPALCRRSSEAVLLAAIHACAAASAPRLDRLVPGRAREGDPVIVTGVGLGGDGIRIDFGGIATWAISLSERAALALVPPGAAPGPVTVCRQGLRSNSVAFGGPPDEGGPSVVRVDPWDGAVGVFRDTPVLARLSHAAAASSLSAASFSVVDAHGPVPGSPRLSPDARVVIWTPERLLAPGLVHFVRASGLRDLRGREVSPHLSRFVPCDLTWGDFPG